MSNRKNWLLLNGINVRIDKTYRKASHNEKFGLIVLFFEINSIYSRIRPILLAFWDPRQYYVRIAMDAIGMTLT